MKNTDIHYSPLVKQAMQLVFSDRITCVLNGYKRTTYRLVTKYTVAMALENSKLSVREFAEATGIPVQPVYGRAKEPLPNGYRPVKLLGYNSQTIRNWLRDYRQGKLCVENACAIRRC